eukprot:gene6678-34474_t
MAASAAAAAATEEVAVDSDVRSRCKTNASDWVFTWHDEQQGKFARHCIVRSDNVWRDQPEKGHTSGCVLGKIKRCGTAPPPPSPPSDHWNTPDGFDCGVRDAAYRYAQKLLPSRGVLVKVFDAMELASQCNMTRPSRSDIHASHSNYLQSIVSNMALGHRRKEGSSSSSSSAVSKGGQGNTGTSTGAGADIDTADTYYVDGKKGNDANPGTAASPVASVGAGVALCRKKAAAIKDGSSDGGTVCTVVVLPASYYLDETLLLTAETHDSGLQLNGLPDPATHELPVLSGGTLLSDLQWTPAPRAAGFPIGVVQAAVPTAVAAAGFAQLFVDGNRVVRARHPNANPGGYYTTGRWTENHTGYFAQAKGWTRSPDYTADRTVTEPNVRNTTRYSDFLLGYGGPVREFNPPAAYWGVNKPPAGGGCKYEVPVAVQYEDAAFAPARLPSTWTSNVSGAGHDKAASNLTFARGGFQEARGSCGKGGHDYFVDNVKELLDVPTELETLISINGSASSPVTNVGVVGFAFAHAAPTFLADYEVPSAGDWSVHRGGAVYIEGVENVTIASNLFDQVGGNGVAISRYARDVVVQDNEFHRIGDSGVLCLGDLKYETAEPWKHLDGNYPVRTVVKGNLMTEIGIFTKQVAGYFQALAVNSSVTGNIILNGPRSGVNFNDAAFGGNLIENNLMANLVRETVDHGPYNSWDRNPYLFRVGADPMNPPTSTPAMSHVHQNFLMCTYGAVKGIDHDDGSGYYDDRDNYMPYCGGKMKGQTQTLAGNVYLFPQWGPECVHQLGGMKRDVPMYFFNNTCISNTPSIYTSCSEDQTVQKLSNNKFYVPGGNAADGKIAGFPCSGGSWSTWQASGEDEGSSINGTMPAVAEMIAWGERLLGF